MWPLFLVLAVVLGAVVLAVSMLLAAIIGGLGSIWPVLLIAAGVWMLCKQDRKSHRKRRDKRAEHAAHNRQPIAAPVAVNEPVPLHPRELPIDVQVKVEQIRRKVEVLLSYADRFSPFSQDLYLVRQTATDYLPRTIETYLNLPKHVAERPIGDDPKTTPHSELKSQLDLLDAKLDEIAQDLQRQDMDRLLANRQFLEERFGKTKASA
jgi:hypothetical protein